MRLKILQQFTERLSLHIAVGEPEYRLKSAHIFNMSMVGFAQRLEQPLYGFVFEVE
jgi:hypothetical protein